MSQFMDKREQLRSVPIIGVYENEWGVGVSNGKTLQLLCIQL